MHQQYRYRGRRHAGHAGGLADRRWPHCGKLLTYLVRQAGERCIVQVLGQLRVFLVAGALDFIGGAFDVAAIAGAHFQIALYLRRQPVIGQRPDRKRRVQLGQRLELDFGAA